jgi:hypothetical protein
MVSGREVDLNNARLILLSHHPILLVRTPVAAINEFFFALKKQLSLAARHNGLQRMPTITWS